ncbi:kinase-like domain-containing protein [Mycena vulgaris]|nr:kinase-like domain-containing protein [Mycena vulgaris]
MTTWSSQISPSLFTMVVGHGASGTVWRSANGSDVVKIFEDGERAFHEAAVLETARELQVPRFRGVVSDGEETGVVMSYAGTPIQSIERAPDGQKQQLAQTITSLHAIGIHHHDVRPDNVLIDNRGALTLIDFDQAEFVHESCVGCPDIDLLTMLDCQ